MHALVKILPRPSFPNLVRPIMSSFVKNLLNLVRPIMSSFSSPPPLAEVAFTQRVLIRSIISRPDGGRGLSGQTVRVWGRVKTGREQGKGAFAFLEVNDGSCVANLQVMVDAKVHALSELTPTGTSVHVEGLLKMPPQGSKQKVELSVVKVIDVGLCDAATYPLPKSKLSLEYLRDFSHLRARTDTGASMARIRYGLSFATHMFFWMQSFLQVDIPIITTSDCEGAGEMFQVTTLMSKAERLEKELKESPAPSEADIESAKLIVKEKGEAVAQLKSAKVGKKEITAAVAELTAAKENLAKLEERVKMEERVRLHADFPIKDGKIDYSEDFFSRPAFLTVSGQLHLETYACSHGNVYTFGPTFRAENSHTSRHIAEFRMVEAESAGADLQAIMNCAEEYVKFLCQWLLDHCLDDMEFITSIIDKGAIDRLKMVASSGFRRITYTEAISILEEAEASKVKKFDNKVEWGIDLASEHERYLTEEKYKAPVIVYNYPKGIKAFYMKLNDDGKTVAAMDVLVPKVGELIGGSQREENYEVLKSRMLDQGIPLEPYQWYLDTRRHGTTKHSGFGLGFDRMVLFATGMENIRDVIPFPRYPGRADL